jgi:hypothetical protein
VGGGYVVCLICFATRTLIFQTREKYIAPVPPHLSFWSAVCIHYEEWLFCGPGGLSVGRRELVSVLSYLPLNGWLVRKGVFAAVWGGKGVYAG